MSPDANQSYQEDWNNLVQTVQNLDQFQIGGAGTVRELVKTTMLSDVVGDNFNYNTDTPFMRASTLLERLRQYDNEEPARHTLGTFLLYLTKYGSLLPKAKATLQTFIARYSLMGSSTAREESSDMKPEDIDSLVEILSDYLGSMPIDPRLALRNLVAEANLPRPWEFEVAGTATGNINVDARSLIRWALAKGTNTRDPRFTTLGSILRPLLNYVGLEDTITISALIRAYGLYLNKDRIEALTVRYQVPVPAQIQAPVVENGPDIDWQGPTDAVELQAWFKPPPDMQDVGFLKRAIERATSVCRVEVLNLKRTGTGFLVGEGLVLTNYHVLKFSDNEDIDENARNTQLRFGYFTGDEGQGTEGQIFKLAANKPIVKASLTSALDYVLLRVEDSILQAANLKAAEYSLDPPNSGMGLNILQHPEGDTMKLAVSSDGVTGVYEGKGLLQYITRAALGSSGAPCFNDDWEVVALHHAQRSRAFGTIREGILFRSIHQEIKDLL
jgi:endonuclease G